MNNKNIRMQKIIELLDENKTMSVKELAETFEVSEMTIRRDLEQLRKNNAVERSYGRATLQNYKKVQIESGGFYDIAYEQIRNLKEKESIARYAASLVDPHDILIVDSGTTNTQLAKHLVDKEKITVLCYNFNILNELRRASNINLIFAGGYYHPEDQMFTSKENVEFIRSIRANKMFLSASGFHETLGVTCIHSHEVDNKRAAIASSAVCILLMDSSKFGKVQASFIASLDEIDAIVTDAGIPQEWRRMLEEKGIELHIAR
ncbi:DeoR/GlpR family DNA-binding transcription regulator [Anaerotruncus rubiinfantis]|uniref:DeoR/GlpR family DNA-binding transcription regulator n=1 Tax=Anaerotruncus rubiinfantis TaxID=1720200 RepID=UPI0011CBB5ED|nr:DeoR/GlpR family DNA-binding transcription regulator [Anaerotruncus rubiinfantis]